MADAMLQIAAVLPLLLANSSAVSANCRGEVAATFQKVIDSGSDIPTRNDDRHQRSCPRDRKRRILDHVGGRPPTELIRVGERMSGDMADSCTADRVAIRRHILHTKVHEVATA